MDSRTPTHQSADEGDCRAQRVDHPQNRPRKPGRKQKQRVETGLISENLAVTIRHFFPGFNKILNELPDVRNPEMSTYSASHLIQLGLLMFMFQSGSRRQLKKDSDSENFRKNLLQLSESQEDYVANPDTLAYFFESLDPNYFACIPSQLVRQLIQKRVLENHRFDGEYLIAIDAVKIYSFKKKHCPHCTYREHENGTVSYFHYVLEAKLIAGDFVFSIASEFIENPDGIFDKQDCETKSAYRLIPRIKEMFPRLAICLLLDGLYLNQHIMEMCEDNDWSYFITFKDGSAKQLRDQADLSFELNPENQRQQESENIQQNCRWATNLDHHGHNLHVIESKGVENKTDKFFAYATNIRPSHDNVFELTNEGGRARWKIENQGFNTQKNHGFKLEHPYSLNDFAWKNFYILMQITHTIEQLTLNSDLFRKLQKQFHLRNGVALQKAQEMAANTASSLLKFLGSRKNVAKRLLEAMRQQPWDAELLTPTFTQSIQIRFNST